MRSITDEDLVLHHYQELEPTRAVEVRDAIVRDPEVAARHRALVRSLAAASAAPALEPTPDLGARMWARVEPKLGPQQTGFRPAPWQAIAAGLALAAVGLALWSTRVPMPAAPFAGATAPAAAFTPAARERVLLTRVAHHLDGSQRLFASVSNTEHVDLGEARAWAQRALTANRVYRSAAAGAGEKRMVTLLDAMEPLLIEIANAPETMTPGELAFLQQRIDEADLLFRMRSTQQRIETRANQPNKNDVQPALRSDI